MKKVNNSVVNDELRSADECLPRSGLPNFFAKCQDGASVRIAYFGGSITGQEGWRVQSLELFRRLYPESEFEEINAAIGGTGSQLGVYRLGHDVLAHKPDLLFVEFATNDGGRGDTEYMEGIVRGTWETLPECDICFVYTVAGEKAQKSLEGGRLYVAASAHERVADHYAIPSIHMGLEAARLAAAGKLEWKAPNARVEHVAGAELDKASGAAVNENGKIPFANDGVHPYLDTGHRLYTAAIERSIPKLDAVSGAVCKRNSLVEPLSDGYIRSVTAVDAGSLELSSDWARVDNPAELFGDKCEGYINKFVPSVWKAGPDSSMAFRFKGRSIMIYTIVGPGVGFIEYEVDGVKQKVNLFDPYSGYWRLFCFFPTENLDASRVHSLSIRVLADRVEKRAIVASVGREEGYDECPSVFIPTDFYIGGICIENGNIILPVIPE